MKIGFFPKEHPWVSKFEKFWQSLGVIVSSSQDPHFQDAAAIFVHPMHSYEYPEAYVTPHLVSQIGSFDFIEPRSRRVASLLFNHFGELLRTSNIQPQTNLPAVLTHDGSTRLYACLLAKLGYSSFLILHSDDADEVTRASFLKQDLEGQLFGSKINLALYRSLTLNPVVSSVLVSSKEFAEDDESYKTICYLNFLVKGAFIVSSQAAASSVLQQAALESAIPLIMPQMLLGFVGWRFLHELQLKPAGLTLESYLEKWTASL